MSIIRSDFIDRVRSITRTNLACITRTISTLDTITLDFDQTFGHSQSKEAELFRSAMQDASRACSSLIVVMGSCDTPPILCDDGREAAIS